MSDQSPYRITCPTCHAQEEVPQSIAEATMNELPMFERTIADFADQHRQHADGVIEVTGVPIVRPEWAIRLTGAT